MEEQRDIALRRVEAADRRIGERDAHSEAVRLSECARSAELATVVLELATEKDKQSTIVAELDAKLTAQEDLAQRDLEDRFRLHAELVEATVRGEQVSKELVATHQQLAHLEGELRQREVETEQSRRALDKAVEQERALRQEIALAAVESDEHLTIVAELNAKLTAQQDLASRSWEDRCRLQAELLESTFRREQVAKELTLAHQQLELLKSELRQRQEETEQSHRALGEAGEREAGLRQEIALGADREAALAASLAVADDRTTRLSAQRYSALANLRSARSQVSRMAARLQDAEDLAYSKLGEIQVHLDAAQSEARVAAARAEAAERVAIERLEEIAQLNAKAGSRDTQRAQLEMALAERHLEAEKHKATAEWLRQVHIALQSSPSWWRLLYPSLRRRLEKRRLFQSGLFNEQQYLDHYPEVAEAGLNPLRHYILHGLAEGRKFW